MYWKQKTERRGLSAKMLTVLFGCMTTACLTVSIENQTSRCALQARQVMLQVKSYVCNIFLIQTTPLHQACLHGHVHVVKLLLEWKADVSARIIDCRNPLDCAIDKDNRGCVQVILQHDTWKKAMRNAYLDKITGALDRQSAKIKS